MKIPDDQYYALLMDDHSTPGYVSADKPYFGTLQDIQSLMTNLNDNYSETKEAFAAFLNGNVQVTHVIAFNQIPLLTPVSVCYERSYTLAEQQWEHINTWGYPYLMKADSINITQIVLKHEEKWYRCIRACFQNLQYGSVVGGWIPVKNRFWGLPGILDVQESENGIITLCNRLYIVEKAFATKQDALASFDTLPPVFDGIIAEIFGDG